MFLCFFGLLDYSDVTTMIISEVEGTERLRRNPLVPRGEGFMLKERTVLNNKKIRQHCGIIITVICVKFSNVN